MGYGQGWMFGMNLPWWIVGTLVVVVLLVLLFRRQSVTGGIAAPRTAIEVLERRYAAGEISTEKFEERRTHLSGSMK